MFSCRAEFVIPSGGKVQSVEEFAPDEGIDASFLDDMTSTVNDNFKTSSRNASAATAAPSHRKDHHLTDRYGYTRLSLFSLTFDTFASTQIYICSTSYDDCIICAVHSRHERFSQKKLDSIRHVFLFDLTL